jgi:hypothetical protein
MFALLLRALHLVVIVFVLVTPHITWPADQVIPILLTHFVTCISLMVHWAFNDNTCFLTLLESKISGVPMDETLMQQIVSPIYTMSHDTYGAIAWTVTIVNSFISGKKLLELFCVSKEQQQI